MPLTLTREIEGLVPVGGHDVAVHLRCDRCGESLRPEAGGLAAWQPEATESYLDVVFLHHSCLEGYGDEGRKKLEKMELETFLDSLIHNLEVAG